MLMADRNVGRTRPAGGAPMSTVYGTRTVGGRGDSLVRSTKRGAAAPSVRYRRMKRCSRGESATKRRWATWIVARLASVISSPLRRNPSSRSRRNFQRADPISLFTAVKSSHSRTSGATSSIGTSSRRSKKWTSCGPPPVNGPARAAAEQDSLQWQAQSKPHAPLFGTPPHVMPGGQVPHLQKLHVRPLSLGSPHGIDSPVQAHEVAPVAVQVMPLGQSAGSPPN
jgi:hypothetical protein